MAIPKTKAFSPKTRIASATTTFTTDGAGTIVIDNTVGMGIDAFIDASTGAPSEATLSITDDFETENEIDYETILYTSRSTTAMTLTGVKHLEGSARDWSSGTMIASHISAHSWNKVVDHTEEDAVSDDVHGSKTYSDTKVSKAGDSLTGDLDFGLNAILKYTEGSPKIHTHNTAGNLTLNLQDGNTHIANIGANVDKVLITNAPLNEVSSLTLRLVNASTYTVTWLDKTGVVSDSTTISAHSSDNSFNSTSEFAEVLQLGDLISVTGFVTTTLNTDHRVVNATTDKIIVTTAISTGEAVGESVTIERNNLLAEIPDNPEACIPKDFVLYTYDGVRWNISEVGEF